MRRRVGSAHVHHCGLKKRSEIAAVCACVFLGQVLRLSLHVPLEHFAAHRDNVHLLFTNDSLTGSTIMKFVLEQFVFPWIQSLRADVTCTKKSSLPEGFEVWPALLCLDGDPEQIKALDGFLGPAVL